MKFEITFEKDGVDIATFDNFEEAIKYAKKIEEDLENEPGKDYKKS